MKRLVFPLLVGVLGAAILASFGVWQLQRAEWKGAILQEIETRIAGAAVPLPADPDPETDRFAPVRISGRVTGDELLVLTSLGGQGGGYRVISAFETDTGRRILVDEGFIRTGEAVYDRPAASMSIVGNLYWPDEVDGYTPAPDDERGIWFGRDVAAMAAALDTEPVLVVARTTTGSDARATAVPVGTEGIPNNHLGYAVQWFGMAAVWLAMTVFWVRRRGGEA